MMDRVIFEVECAKVAELTAINDHNGAYVAGCELLIKADAPCANLKDRFAKVGELADLEGYLPHDLSNYRYGLYKTMIDIARNTLDAELFDLFYDCF